MDIIVIDPSTRHVGISSMLQTSATPSLRKSSISRSIKTTLNLVGYRGPKTKLSIMSGNRMYVAPLDTCTFILDNKGRGWEDWSENSGQEFKQALRERVERVPASVEL